MTEVLERERKWEVDEDFVLPSLDDIIPGDEVEHSTIELTSAYFDTADRDLSAHGLLLRRRDGDADAGWQLKMPDSNGRIEIRYPSADTMPSDLSALSPGSTWASSSSTWQQSTLPASAIASPIRQATSSSPRSPTTTYARPSTRGEQENRSGGARSKSNSVPPPMRCRASSPNA